MPQLPNPGESFTNDGQGPVEFNPPGIVVHPGETLECDENGHFALTGLPNDPNLQPKLTPEQERKRAEAGTAAGEAHAPTSAESTAAGASESGAQSQTEASAAAKRRRSGEQQP